MSARKVSPWVVAALMAVGAAAVGLRFYNRHELQLIDGDGVWRLTYHVKFHAQQTGARVRVAVPDDTPYSRVFRQDVQYSELAAERVHPSRSQSREVGLVTLRPGQYAVSARFDLQVSRRARWEATLPRATAADQTRIEWLRATKTIQADSPLVRDTLQRLQADPDRPSDPVQRLFEFCSRELERGAESSPADALGALETKTGTPLGRARAFVALLRASKVPARLVTGFEVKEEKESGQLQPRTWVEALAGGAWKPYDLENGYAGELPHHFVPVRRDGVEIVHATNTDGLEVACSLMELPATATLGRPRHIVDILDLTRLPLEMHEVLSLILLLPLGALVTTIFRTLIGIRTFGTFTPSLIALSFVFNDWKTGVFVFAAVLALGLVSRSVLDRLKLLMVPRLSVILTLVVLLIVLAVSLLDYYHFTPSAQAVLLPMVILTMTVERFYLTTEEDGPGFALQLLAGTVLVAFCCYLVLCWGRVGRVLFTYPELHLFTLAALVLIGRYTGYRLTELWRFRDLAGPVMEERR